MTAALTFTDLLARAGARLARYGRRWWCPTCEGRTPALAVDLGREVFYCHRCQLKGNRRTLERELGIRGLEPTPAEVHKRQLIRREAERFTAHIQAQRIATAGLLRDLDGYEVLLRETGREELAAGKPVDSKLDKLALLLPWQEQAEARWRRLFDFESNAGELYREYRSRMREAA